MADINLSDYSVEGRKAVSDFLGSGGSGQRYWEDSWVNMAAQLALQKMENDQQMDLWNKMNEYNSPSSQMQRMKEAGLNPMLFYQQGTPGNASSPAGFSNANFQLSPQQDRMNQVKMASETIGMITNLFQNVASMFDTGLDLGIKRNQLAESNYHYAQNVSVLPGFGQGRKANVNIGPSDPMTEGVYKELNPFSGSFDPVAFMVMGRQGKLPSQLWDIWNSVPKRDYSQFRSDYQKYYNEKLLPLFEDWQSGKIEIQDIEKQMKQYELDAMTMIPPELRGILEPIVQYLSPFLKFIFKSSRGTFNHSVQ